MSRPWKAARDLERIGLALADVPESPNDRCFNDDLAGADPRMLRRERRQLGIAISLLPRQHWARPWVLRRWRALDAEIRHAR